MRNVMQGMSDDWMIPLINSALAASSAIRLLSTIKW